MKSEDGATRRPSLYAECLGRFLESVGRKIRTGECSLSDEEMKGMLRVVAHEKLYMPVLEHKFNVCQRTIERWCADGTLPPLMEDDLHRKFLWHDDVELWLMSRKMQE